MKAILCTLLLFTAVASQAAVTANDDSCDIATLPAATLLLPYFEVDLHAAPGQGRTTLFTIVNTTREPQIARVTLWTDLSVPVISFNIFLTGYDVQPVNMHDLLVRGLIAPPNGTGPGTTPGSRSASNISGNPRFRDTAATNCRPPQNPNIIPTVALNLLQAAFTTGNVPALCATPIGTQHTSAIGYATIDLVADCNLSMPDQASYFDDLLYDNVLTGDYQHVSGGGNFASGNPLVHLRAVPEGGNAGQVIETALPWTFYSGRVTNGRDRRQPLPSTFAARVVDGGAVSFQTSLQVWRERTSACGNAAADAMIEFQRFDERENPNTISFAHSHASASLIGSEDYFLATSGDVGGWVYVNAGSNGNRPRQMWVASTMAAEGRYSTSFDVVAMGNGCSPATPEPAPAPRGPRPNLNPRASNTASSPGNTNNDDSCDVGLYPAATLLLPYFEVDVNAPLSVARTTLFTVTNVTPQPQIAHVTMFTDYGYPVLSFNIFLTGFDIQAVNLYDILARGLIAPDGGTSNETTPGVLSAPNVGGNPNHLPTAATTCTQNGQGRGRLPEVLRQNVISALTEGLYPLSCGSSKVGGTHSAAVGYLTIDVAATCTSSFPTEPKYFADEILFDNVLMGDYQIVHPNATTGNFAQGSPMVHIRATPEGGVGGETVETNLTSTFYASYQHSSAPRQDRRQPLPSAYATRAIEGGFAGMQTELAIWREPKTGPNAPCASYDRNANLRVAEIVRFDERENPFVVSQICNFLCPPLTLGTPVTGSHRTDDDLFPDVTSGEIGGWIYLNLSNNDQVQPTRQAWVTTRMSSEGRYSVMFDATGLGNGCSAPAQVSAAPIRPLP
ncbi:MAG TPA: hypothetical protein VF618_09300 [Thermoanaerobaculia bacterium]